MLRRVVSGDVFFAVLAEYRARFEYEAATTEDFVTVVEEISGSDLEWFFDQWVYRAGAPSYRYGWREHEVAGRRFVEVSLEQTQPWPVFVMPIDIGVAGGGEYHSHVVDSDSRGEHFLFPVTAPVDGVDLDPGGMPRSTSPSAAIASTKGAACPPGRGGHVATWG
jgi:aminopeptidase N